MTKLTMSKTKDSYIRISFGAYARKLGYPINLAFQKYHHHVPYTAHRTLHINKLYIYIFIYLYLYILFVYYDIMQAEPLAFDCIGDYAFFFASLSLAKRFETDFLDWTAMIAFESRGAIES